MHQPVDQGRCQGVVHVNESAPFPERVDSRIESVFCEVFIPGLCLIAEIIANREA
jgi:hypothetical protein